MTRTATRSRRILRHLAVVLFFLGVVGAQSVGAQLTFTEYPVPDKPYEITVGPDGNLWFTEENGFSNIGRITPAGVLTLFPIPSGTSAGGITTGPDGNLWFVEYFAGKIGRITTTGSITPADEFSIPSGGQPQGIAAGPDGNLWFTESSGNRIGRITTAGVITEFPTPTTGVRPAEITAGPDGAMWFTESTGNQIGRITSAGVITEYPVPTSGSYPVGITTGPDGNLWFTEGYGNKIGRITPAGVVTEFPLPSGETLPFPICAGPDGSLWFAEWAGNNIGRVTTDGVITVFAPPTPGAITGITGGPDGKIWFAEYTANKVGKATLPTLVPLESITVSPSTVVGCKPATGTVTLTSAVTFDGTVGLASMNSAAGVPPTVTVPAGKVTASFTITTTPVASSVTGPIKATSGGVTKSANLTVRPISVKSVTLVPTAVTGGSSAAGVATLECPAAPGDIVVAISSNNASVANPSVSSITVPAGTTSVAFTISTIPVAANTVVAIKAAANGLSKSANLTVRAPKVASLTLVPNSVIGGDSSFGVVMLDGPAPAGGKVISLTSDNTAVANPEVSSITIAEGAIFGYFNVLTNTVAATTRVHIAATTSGSGKSATLTVQP